MLLAPRSRAARRQSVPRQGHERRRDRSARLSRHEGIRDRLRRLRGAGRQPARRRRGPRLQAADGDLRERPHPDRRARRRRRPIARSNSVSNTRSSASSSASRSSISRASPNKLVMMAVELMIARQLTYFAAREKDRASAATSKPAWPSCWPPASPGRRRQRAADPRRQRLRARIPDQPRPVRRPHPQHLRGRRRDPGHRAVIAFNDVTAVQS
jgi:hypothetical protein